MLFYLDTRINAGFHIQRSSDNCTMRRTLDGTSMSAPLVAGAAALARQYFTQGFYPKGRKHGAEAAGPFTDQTQRVRDMTR